MRKRSTIAIGAACAVGVLLLTLAPPLAGPTHAQGGAVIRLQPSTAQLSVGGTFPVQVVVENVNNLFAVGIQLTFDPNLLEVMDADQQMDGVQVHLGPFLPIGSLDSNQVDMATGHIIFRYSQAPMEPGVSGSGVIATITFRGRALGTSAVTFGDSLLTDPNANLIAATAQNGQIVVGEAAATPTTPPTATPTATPAATPAATPPSPACGTLLGYHTVQWGETLYTIGRAYQVRPQAIALCNNLTNPRVIHSGNRLAIPNDPWSPMSPGTAAQRQFGSTATPTPAPTCRITHVVQRGENLFRISMNYNANMWLVAEVNRIANVRLILAGQTLCIP